MKLDLPTTNDGLIWDIWLSSLRMPSLMVADELQMFEALSNQPDTYQGLAKRLDLTERGVKSLLPMLTAMGLLDKHLDHYYLSECARLYLLPDSPYYWGGMIQSVRAREGAGTFYTLLRSAMVGRRADETYQRPADGWERGELDPEMARSITDCMHSHSLAAALGLARNADFGDVSRLLDVGGGSGAFSIALARAFPVLRCTIMDLPAVCRVAGEYVNNAGVNGQVDTVAVDMFREAWPEGYDALFFSNIFHDWSFDTCAQLAAKAHAVLPSGGRICLHEMLLNDNEVGPLTANAFSVLMLLGTRGGQFTFRELRDLLSEAGFVDMDVCATYGYYSLVVGYKR